MTDRRPPTSGGATTQSAPSRRRSSRYGRIDVLINNAGIIQVGPLDHMKLSDYEDAMNTHFWGPLYMITGGAAAHAPRR